MRRKWKPRKRSERSCEFDVCLSFAGEDRVNVESVADGLRRRGIRVFFDEYEEALTRSARHVEA